ncbi:hypothetical protein BKA70DRAFT_1526577 [Coprinopsis sp. MPI-PUGE-AT-0042]|nr:hypothetical protein BKA70DRAFT_1526577 [Coprinopsis sp. MPI-PUGE-AT-0042]
MGLPRSNGDGGRGAIVHLTTYPTAPTTSNLAEDKRRAGRRSSGYAPSLFSFAACFSDPRRIGKVRARSGVEGPSQSRDRGKYEGYGSTRSGQTTTSRSRKTHPTTSSGQRTARAALKDLSRLAEEQFRTEVNRERNQRRWAAGIGVEDAWMGALREEQEAIYKQIKSEREGVASSSPASDMPGPLARDSPSELPTITSEAPSPRPMTAFRPPPPPLVPPEPELPFRMMTSIPKYETPPLPAGLAPPPPRRGSVDVSTSPRDRDYYGGSIRRPKTTVDEVEGYKPPPRSPWAATERAASSASMTRPISGPSTQVLPQSPPPSRNSPYPTTTASLGRRGSKTSIKSNGSASSVASGRPPSIPERPGESHEDISKSDSASEMSKQQWQDYDKQRLRQEPSEQSYGHRGYDRRRRQVLKPKTPGPPRSNTRSVPVPPVTFDPYGTSQTMRTALHPDDDGAPARKSKSKSISRKASFAEPPESQPSGSVRKRRPLNGNTFVDPEEPYGNHPPRRYNTLSGLPTPPTSASRPRTQDLEFDEYMDQSFDGYDPTRLQEGTKGEEEGGYPFRPLIDPQEYAGGYRNAYDPRSTQTCDVCTDTTKCTRKPPPPVPEDPQWSPWGPTRPTRLLRPHPAPPATAPANRLASWTPPYPPSLSWDPALKLEEFQPTTIPAPNFEAHIPPPNLVVCIPSTLVVPALSRNGRYAEETDEDEESSEGLSNATRRYGELRR